MPDRLGLMLSFEEEASYLDGNAQHEAEEELVLLKQAPADIAIQGVCHILH